ncbi:hypothetical protein KAW80_02660 [Candidatus Babeliales bacterium]|nr:hypothetical protein [Candidatus Babeliales bacterium]
MTKKLFPILLQVSLVVSIFSKSYIFPEQPDSNVYVLKFLRTEESLKRELGTAITENSVEKFLWALIKAQESGIERNILQAAVSRALMEKMHEKVGRESAEKMLSIFSSLDVEDNIVERLKKKIKEEGGVVNSSVDIDSLLNELEENEEKLEEEEIIEPVEITPQLEEKTEEPRVDVEDEKPIYDDKSRSGQSSYGGVVQDSDLREGSFSVARKKKKGSKLLKFTALGLTAVTTVYLLYLYDQKYMGGEYYSSLVDQLDKIKIALQNKDFESLKKMFSSKSNSLETDKSSVSSASSGGADQDDKNVGEPPSEPSETVEGSGSEGEDNSGPTVAEESTSFVEDVSKRENPLIKEFNGGVVADVSVLTPEQRRRLSSLLERLKTRPPVVEEKLYQVVGATY